MHSEADIGGLRKVMAGLYRTTIANKTTAQGQDVFGQLRRRDDGWDAEIRIRATGEIHGFIATACQTRREALQELRWGAKRYYDKGAAA